MRYEILRLAKGGTGVSTVTGKVFFIEGGLPGETGEAEIIEEKSGFGRARVLTRDTVSPDRVETDCCPNTSRCDGCGFRHVCHAHALELKAGAVYADIIRNAHLEEMPYELYGVSGELDGLRRRARIHIDGGRIGFYARGSHQLISASSCCVIAPQLRDVILQIEKKVRFPKNMRAEMQIDLDGDNRCFVHLKPVQVRTQRRAGATPSVDNRALESVAAQLAQVGCFSGVRCGDSCRGESMIREVTAPEGLVPTATFRRVGDFSQATLEANAHIHRLVRDILTEVSPAHVVDLFCGSGNLTFRAATVVSRVDGFEFFCDREAFETGRRANASVLAPDAKVTLSLCDLTKGLPAKAADADFIVCDPAREGLSDKLAADLCRCQAKHILYVSCEASCLARDIVRLAGAYRVERLAFVDMFPQTPHVETVALLIRNS